MSEKRWSIAALALGVVALATGFTLIPPLAGIALAIVAKEKEPQAANLAHIGLCLSVAGLILGAVLVALVGTSPLGLDGINVILNPPQR